MGTHPSPCRNGSAADSGWSLLDSLGEACVALDAGGRVLYCNPACAALFHVPAGALLGRLLAAAVAEFSDSPCEEACFRALRTGAPQEAQHTRGERTFHWRVYPTPEGVVALVSDATTCRRLQEQMLHAQKVESLGLLAGRLAHDFNNLLVGVLTAAELLRRDLPPGSEGHELAEMIGKAAERAAGLSRQMLVYAGKGQPVRRPLGLNAAVEEGLVPLAAAVPNNISLVHAPAPDLPPVVADPGQLQQVITNLVLNAAEAIGTRAGRVRLTTGVEVVNGEGPPAGAQRLLDPPAGGRYAYLEVSDDGCGMAAEVRGRMCDPFFTTKGKGRGLGLSAVQGIVRAHGGGLRVVSVPGGGTAVRVLLPVE